MIDAYKEMYGKLPMQFQLESYEESKLGDYICDTVDDLKDLPEDCEMGSIARIITRLQSIERTQPGNGFCSFPAKGYPNGLRSSERNTSQR